MKKTKIILLIVGIALLLSVIGAGCAIAAHAETYSLKKTVGGDDIGGIVQLKTVISTEGDLRTEEYEYGETVTAPTVTREGYNFVKWVYKGTSTEYIPGTMPAENLEVEAVWDRIIYTVTYNTQIFTLVDPITGDPAPVIATYNIAYGDDLIIPTSLVREGYTLMGWSSDGYSLATLPTTVTHNLSYIAMWELNTYAVNFDSAGGSAVSNQSISHGSTVTVPTAPTRTGYTFAGWSPSISTPITADTTFTAQWQINTYDIVFRTGLMVLINPITQDPDELTAMLTYNYGQTIVPPADDSWPEGFSLVREGYTFLGWSATPDGAVITSWPTATANATYYAVWEKNSYTIIWDANGGTFVDP